MESSHCICCVCSAPFTMQRLCELVCFPRKHYKKIDKFLRAIEKNILVVTTVGEDGRYGTRSPGSEQFKKFMELSYLLV